MKQKDCDQPVQITAAKSMACFGLFQSCIKNPPMLTANGEYGDVSRYRADEAYCKRAFDACVEEICRGPK